MQPPNAQNERSPLRAVTNTANSPLTRRAGSTPVKKVTANVKKAPMLRMSLPLPQTDSRETGSDKQKRTRASLSKRVSFGGNSINVFYKQSEFSPQENEPPVKVPRTMSRSSPSLQRSPSLLRPDARVFPMGDDGVSDDNSSMPSAPNMPEDSFFPERSRNPSPPLNENPSPAAARRDSIGANDRRSFGIFIDEDITRGEGDVVTDDQDDMTIDIPRLSCISKVRRTSNASVLSDGDITQNLYNIIPDMLKNEDKSDDTDSTEDINRQASPPNSSADEDPEQSIVRTHGFPEQLDCPEPKLPYGSDNVSLAEKDHGMLNSGSNDRSESDVLPHEEGAQEHSIENIATSAGADGPNETSVCPSPAVSVRVRPVPPNCRKLFDGDANEDEDNTLHYHEQSGRPLNVPNVTQRKLLGELSALPSTPMSAAQSKLRSAIEERASASGKRNAASKLRELSSSALRSSQPGAVVSEREGAPESSFSFRDFLQSVQLNFDVQAKRRPRGQSLAPQNYPTENNFDRSSIEGEILESIRKVSVFETFKHQIEILKEKLAQDKHNLEVLDHQIESTRPPLFSKISEFESMPIHETTIYRVSMKRLRKLSTLKTKEEWVTDRKLWETDLREKLEAAIAAVEQDKIALCDSTEEHKAACSLLIEQVASLGFGAAFTDENAHNDSTEEDNKERAAFIQEMSKYRDVRGYVESLKSEREDLQTRGESVAPLKFSLSAACNELRKNANSNSERSMRKMITEREELNSIVCGVSGVNLTRVNKNSISLRAVGMMDIQFSLHDEKVINTSCKTVSLSNEVSCPAWESYIDGAVSLVNYQGRVKNVKYLRDIPGALYRCTSALRQARLVYEDAAFFLDRNMGKILFGGLRQDEGTPCLDLTVEISFYSLKLRSKFDITVTVTTRPPTESSSHLVQDATVKKIHRYFGDKPEDKLISDVLIESGRRDLGVYSLADGLTGVWRSLS